MDFPNEADYTYDKVDWSVDFCELDYFPQRICLLLWRIFRRCF